MLRMSGFPGDAVGISYFLTVSALLVQLRHSKHVSSTWWSVLILLENQF